MRTYAFRLLTSLAVCLLAGPSCRKPEQDEADRGARPLDGAPRIAMAWQAVQRCTGGRQESTLDEAAERVTGARDSVKGPCAVLDYLAARVAYARTGKVDEQALLARHSVSMVVENAMVLDQIEADASSKGVYGHTALLARLLPVSRWRRTVDGGRSLYLGDIKPPRPEIPSIHRDKIMAVGPLLDAAGLPDLAWRAHAEAVYACYVPAWPRGEATDSWLSEPAAEQWLQVALYLLKAGRADLGLDFLLKAAVFGDEKTRSAIREVAAKWLAPTARHEPPPMDAKVRLEALVKVARLYAEMNAHPRALRLLDDFPDLLGKERGLREEIEQGWLAVVKDASRAVEKLTLYGTEVFPTGDPLRIRVPWAFSDEALRQIREDAP